MATVPHTSTGEQETKAEFRELACAAGLVGAANDTKWQELLAVIRARKDWRPWRAKWLTGLVTEWDVGWSYHLPYPFVGVEWFDIGLYQEVKRGRLMAPQLIDHGACILPALHKIGLEHKVIGEIVRVWGYLPKSFELLPLR